MNETGEITQRAPQTLAIGVDVIGQMKVLKKTFTERYAFIPELLQNAQRAGASKVEVSLSEKNREISVLNNGDVCEDLSKVFTACTSGWTAKVMAAQDPFGTGFFSVMIVAGEVEIRSGNKVAVWDVDRMFAEETLDVVTVREVVESVSGFHVTLRKVAENVDFDLVKGRFRHQATIIEPTVIVSGKMVAKIDPLAKSDDEKGKRFCVKVDTPRYKGVLYPAPSFSGVHTYYQRREVAEIYPGCLGGRLFIENDVLSPRAPDRTQWIRDEKYTALMTELKGTAKGLLLKVLKNGTNLEIDRFADAIQEYLTPEEYEPHLRFDISLEDKILLKSIAGLTDAELEGKKPEELRFDVDKKIAAGAFDNELIADQGFELVPDAPVVPVAQAALAAAAAARTTKVDDGSGVTPQDAPIGDLLPPARLIAPATDSTASESTPTGATITVVMSQTVPLAAGILPPVAPAISAQAPARPDKLVRQSKKSTVREVFEKTKAKEKTGEKLSVLRREKVVAWAHADETVRLRKAIGQALDCGLRIVIVRNKLHAAAIKRQENAVHVLDLREVIFHEGEITNKRPTTSQEERALHLLQLIEEKVYGKIEGRFSLCDAEVKKIKTLGGQVIEETRDDPLAFVWTGKVYFPRKHLFLGDLTDLATQGLTTGDRVFLARHAVTIAHEVAHLHGLADKTREHAEKTNDLTETVLELAFPRKG